MVCRVGSVTMVPKGPDRWETVMWFPALSVTMRPTAAVSGRLLRFVGWD